jgi:S-adenosylmethionine:tRNA ribosyltransferase-isomerase
LAFGDYRCYTREVRTSDFDYELPVELIAQSPTADQDASRLLVLQRSVGRITHGRFPDLLRYLQRNDLLVLNNSRVLPARLRGTKADSGGAVETL